MTWVRRAAAALCAALMVVLLGGQAWAGTVTDEHGGWAFVTPPTDGVSSSQAVTVNQPAMGAGDHQRARFSVCGAPDGSGTQTVAVSTWVTWTANAAVNLPTTACAAPAVLMAYRLVVSSARGVYTVLQWQADAQPQVGTFVPGSSPSPYPSPYASPSPVTVYATHYAYPSPQAGGGGSVDSCASDTCTVQLVAGTTVGLSDEQALALWLFLGTLLLIALTGFLLRHGRALRV